MAEQCSFCGNTHLTHKTTRYIHQQNGELLFVEQVPCLECDYCGEQYFEIEVLKRIEADHRAIVEHRKPPSRFVRVAVQEFESATR